jgi:hypothetical protein
LASAVVVMVKCVRKTPSVTPAQAAPPKESIPSATRSEQTPEAPTEQ